MQAVVLLTFVGPLAEDTSPQFHEREQDCGCCTSIPDTGHALFTTGVWRSALCAAPMLSAAGLAPQTRVRPCESCLDSSLWAIARPA